jgi:hypothetical protein
VKDARPLGHRDVVMVAKGWAAMVSGMRKHLSGSTQVLMQAIAGEGLEPSTRHYEFRPSPE